MTTAAISEGGIGIGASLSARTSTTPWNRPQSTRKCLPPVETRCLLPVTVPAAPMKVSSATRLLRDSGTAQHILAGTIERHRARDALVVVDIQARVDQGCGIVVVDEDGAGVFFHQ